MVISSAHTQFTLDLGHRTALGRDDFLVAPSNQDAVAWIDLWPEWPAPALVLYGPAACGKTHLAAVWGEKSGASFVRAQDLRDDTVRDIAATGRHLILKHADTVIGSLEPEKGLFHLYNLFREEGRSLLITMEQPPVRLDFAVADLASRLRAAPTVAIREPDEMLLSAILVKLFNDRQLRVGDDVIRYIVTHMERSFSAASNIVSMADNLALNQKRPVTIPLLREVLGMTLASDTHLN